MALWFDLKINKDTIGFFVATRQHALNPKNKISTYEVEVHINDDTYTYTIEHDYDLGALELVHKALSVHLGKPT